MENLKTTKRKGGSEQKQNLDHEIGKEKCGGDDYKRILWVNIFISNSRPWGWKGTYLSQHKNLLQTTCTHKHTCQMVEVKTYPIPPKGTPWSDVTRCFLKISNIDAWK